MISDFIMFDIKVEWGLFDILSCHVAFLHVHIDRRATYQLSIKAATIDFTNSCCRDNTNLWISLNSNLRFLFSCQSFILSLCTY